MSSRESEKKPEVKLYESVHAGFPSPAEDIPGTALDINKLVVKKILDGDPVIPLTVTYPPKMIAIGIDHAVAGAKKQPLTTRKRVIIPSEIVDKSNAKQFYFPDSAY